jgi:hypothetical protein
MEGTDWLNEGFDSAQAQFLMVTAITHHRFSSPLWGADEVRSSRPSSRRSSWLWRRWPRRRSRRQSCASIDSCQERPPLSALAFEGEGGRCIAQAAPHGGPARPPVVAWTSCGFLVRVAHGNGVADRGKMHAGLPGVFACVVVVTLSVASHVQRVDPVLGDQVLLDRSRRVEADRSLSRRKRAAAARGLRLIRACRRAHRLLLDGFRPSRSSGTTGGSTTTSWCSDIVWMPASHPWHAPSSRPAPVLAPGRLVSRGTC